MENDMNPPNPGSDEAKIQGCRCPIYDNAKGKGYLGGVEDENGKPIFVINLDCPLHGGKK